MEIQIDYSDDDFRGLLDRLDADLRPAVLQAAAWGVRHALEEHFLARQREPRRDGLTPVGFWAGSDGDSVRERTRDPEVGPGGAVIRIDSPALARKLDPSAPPILPTAPRRYLAVPATDAANLFPGLPRDNPALAEKPVGRAPHPAGGDRPALLDASGSPLYWLIRSADPPFDPRALPSRPALHRAALSAAGDAIKSLLP